MRRFLRVSTEGRKKREMPIYAAKSATRPAPIRKIFFWFNVIFKKVPLVKILRYLGKVEARDEK